MTYMDHAAALQRHLLIAPFQEELATLGLIADQDLWGSIIEHAARYAESELDALGQALDRDGARLVDGKVRTSVAHHEAWASFKDLAWVSLVAPEPYGSQQPQSVLIACEELFNRASPSFYMLPTSTRSGASLLLQCASPDLRDRWVPKLLAGDWTATICISEPDAGSDVGRIRTKAVHDGNGWLVSGEKCWISFGDHDLSERIGHLMLARSSEGVGTRGLSLFLVPSTTEDGTANGVSVARIEEKLGLHGSPTCVMNFSNARAELLGAEGRGLQQMFHMMLEMRLSCGPQGTGLASAAFEIARSYAQERRQGGHPNSPPMKIVEHADVQRQLLSMAAMLEVSRGTNFAAAQILELATRETGEKAREHWQALAQFLLPIVKDGAAWAAFDVSSRAVQVLGGAGYTQEWPVERMLRDARVFPIFEGTSGIQALDLIHRRVWRDRRAGIEAFLNIARDEATTNPVGKGLLDTLARLDETSQFLAGLEDRPRDAEAGASAFLDLCKAAVHGWIAARIMRLSGSDPVAKRMQSAANFYLAEMPARAAMFAALAQTGEQALKGIGSFLSD